MKYIKFLVIPKLLNNKQRVGYELFIQLYTTHAPAPMQGPACHVTSIQTQIPPQLHNAHQSYTILLLHVQMATKLID